MDLLKKIIFFHFLFPGFQSEKIQKQVALKIAVETFLRSFQTNKKKL